MVRVVKLGVLASGRGSNLQAIIDSIEAGKLDAEIAVVISDNEGAQALERARRHGVEAVYIPPGTHKTFLDPEVEESYVACLKEHEVELVILAGFMRVLKEKFFDEFEGRIVNIHPALLPSFPGLRAQKQALEGGAKVSGATVHFVSREIDAGPIIVQATVEVSENDTEQTLSQRILREEHKLYPRAIQLYAEGRLRVEGRRVRILPPGETGREV